MFLYFFILLVHSSFLLYSSLLFSSLLVVFRSGYSRCKWAMSANKCCHRSQQRFPILLFHFKFQHISISVFHFSVSISLYLLLSYLTPCFSCRLLLLLRHWVTHAPPQDCGKTSSLCLIRCCRAECWSVWWQQQQIHSDYQRVFATIRRCWSAKGGQVRGLFFCSFILQMYIVLLFIMSIVYNN